MTTVVSPYVDAGIAWFAGVGFRPAVWTPPHRHDEVDPPRLVPAPDADVPLLSKYDAPLDTPGNGFGFVLWPDTAAPAAPQITAASLAGVVPGPPPFTAGPLIPGPWHPPVDYPCNCITPDSPDMPPVAPVPLEASGLFLLTGLAVFFIIRRFK